MFGTVDSSIQSVGLAFVCVPKKCVWDACFVIISLGLSLSPETLKSMICLIYM